MALTWTPAGGGQIIREGVTPSSGVGPRPVQNNAVGSSPAAVQAMIQNTPSPVTFPQGKGAGTFPATTETTTETTPQPEFDWNKFAWEENERRRKQNAIATLRGLMTEYGMESLMSKIEQYVVDGYDADAIMVLIRTTPEYKQRFPAMEALTKKGRAISEAAYIEYEKTASGLERQYGLPSGMLMNSVTNLLENEVSTVELNDRVLLAASSAYQLPEEFRNQFRDYYGVDSGGLVAYYLDPAVATPLLQKQTGAALIGSEAARQNVGIQVGLAEELQSLGVTSEEARTGFGKVARQGTFTSGRGDVVSQEALVRGNLMNNEQAMKEIERAAGARTGRFQEGGGYIATQQGVGGLASSSR